MKFLTQISCCFLISVVISCRKDPAVIELNEPDPSELAPYLMDTSSEWTYTLFYGDAGIPEHYYRDTIELYFEGDTTLQRKTIFDFNDESEYPESRKYFKLKFISRTYHSDPPYPLEHTESGIKCYLRVDSTNGRVYAAHVPGSTYSWLGEEKEAVLYDFNVEHKDTLPFNTWNNGSLYKYRARNVSIIEIGGIKLKTFNIQDQTGLIRGTCIEGIGALQGFEKSYQYNSALLRFENKDFVYEP